MRNTTKLKAILLRYTVALDMSDDGEFTLTLIDKLTHQGVEFVEKSYSSAISRAYRHLMKKLKDEERGIT